MPCLLYHLKELLHIHTQSRTSQEKRTHLCCMPPFRKPVSYHCNLLMFNMVIPFPLSLPIKYDLVNFFLPICRNWLSKFFTTLSKSILTNICVSHTSFTEGEIDTTRLRSRPASNIFLIKSCMKHIEVCVGREAVALHFKRSLCHICLTYLKWKGARELSTASHKFQKTLGPITQCYFKKMGGQGVQVFLLSFGFLKFPG